MSWGIALVLGFVQGLTEFLPISSSAHMRVVAALAGWPDPGAAFTAVTQLGTESAVLLYFRRDITAIVTAWTRSVRGRVPRSDPHARLGWYVIIGTVPIGILGLAFQDTIETALRDLRLVAATLIVFGLVLGLEYAFLDVGFGDAADRVAEFGSDELRRIGVDHVAGLQDLALLHEELHDID